jgi:hypothetical protein
MTETEVFLEHFGVRGMKWGVRREQKRLDKADAKWQKNVTSAKTYIAVHNRAAELANAGDIDRINNKAKYRGQDFTHDSPLRQQYYREHEEAFNRRMQQAADEIIGPNPSGTLRLHIDVHTGESSYQRIDASHSIDDLPKIVLKKDRLGHIIKFELETDSMKHSELSHEFLEHFGVRGMHWGVRNPEKKAARQRNRELNRESRRKDTEARDKEIEAARNRIKSGKNQGRLHKAEMEYAANRERLGSREANKILNQARQRNLEDAAIAQQAKSGRETTAAVLLATGGILLTVLSSQSR